MKKSVVIGSRGSALAMTQSEWVAARIREYAPDTQVRIQVIKPSGDTLSDLPLAQIGGKGLFTKEIEEALLAKTIDLAVHSLKDVPFQLPDGITLAAALGLHDSFIARAKRNVELLHHQRAAIKNQFCLTADSITINYGDFIALRVLF